MNTYQQLGKKIGLKPISTPDTLATDGTNVTARHNYLTAANAVELITETLADIAKRTDSLTLDVGDKKMLRRDITDSVVRALESRINAALELEINQ